MARSPQVVRTVRSGVPELVREVEIYDTTIEHVRQRHGEVYEQFESVISTIESPTRVHESKTHPTSVVFINDEVTSSGGDPLRVPVKVYDNRPGIMSTAYFSSSKDQGPILWERSDDD